MEWAQLVLEQFCFHLWLILLKLKGYDGAIRNHGVDIHNEQVMSLMF